MTDLKLQNKKVRFEARFGDYFFARCLVTLNVVDAGVTPRKYKKFLIEMKKTFTAKTTMNDIQTVATACKIKTTKNNY